ncbi:uncharacterized protein [Argopecten irradians]|uniref:uncharacterized protein n=1 Tax=Argopecten irradians TaxID=31199 RepID=UPI0037241B2A
MPTSTLAQECSSQEVNLQDGQKKKTSIQEKNVKKLQVSVKPPTCPSEQEHCLSPVDSAHVLLKPTDQYNHFNYDQKPCHGQYSVTNGHVNGYAASFVPSQNGKMDSYVDLSQCEKENKRNLQYTQHQMTNGHQNVHTVSGQYQKQLHSQDHCCVSMEGCGVSQSHACSKVTSKTSKCPLNKSCCLVLLIVLQLIWMGLFAWLLIDKLNSHHSDHGDHLDKDHTSGHHRDDNHPITMSPPVKIPQPPHQYPTYAPPQTAAKPTVPIVGIKMEIDPSFLSRSGNIVMWKYPEERHLTGIEYHNGYFRVNVTGFYFVQSTLSLDHRRSSDNENIRVNHCMKVDGHPKMDVCENTELAPIKAGASTVQDPMLYLESGTSVHVSISHMTKIYDSVTQNKFVMYLQRAV